MSTKSKLTKDDEDERELQNSSKPAWRLLKKSVAWCTLLFSLPHPNLYQYPDNAGIGKLKRQDLNFLESISTKAGVVWRL